jgi:hypothetical protein
VGRMFAPAGLAGSPVQMIYHNNNGALTWLGYQAWTGEDSVTNVHQAGLNSRVVYTRNLHATSSGAFYMGGNATGVFPFKVSHGGMYVSDLGIPYVIIGSSTTGSQRVNFSISPFTMWHDVTRNYPNAASSNPGAITGITVV